ncbi:hypothetical protein O181_008142 [Austropuccinia psidii MF-1]|uniref:Uncharacterized protein n=1 Tax=Austropuccinia psidii MF-1 TaxID=1389203 RepID=A0A9Q3BN95_9BASI|nr:hypothetical protein [Austropuccinia psidii MF-1]
MEPEAKLLPSSQVRPWNFTIYKVVGHQNLPPISLQHCNGCSKPHIRSYTIEKAGTEQKNCKSCRYTYCTLCPVTKIRTCRTNSPPPLFCFLFF